MPFKHPQHQHHGAGWQVQEGHGGAHHVYGGVIHVMPCTCFYPKSFVMDSIQRISMISNVL